MCCQKAMQKPKIKIIILKLFFGIFLSRPQVIGWVANINIGGSSMGHLGQMPPPPSSLPNHVYFILYWSKLASKLVNILRFTSD